MAIENAAPVLTEDCLRKTAGELLEMIRDNFSDSDGICFALHGAGVAEGIPDLEAFCYLR
ncbi:M81 family metallopeptidase [Bacilliculturomica massiliensis]|uniref:M81 family metallopeptidase n=1 Tax=Bacilliculturomica massiliensis TaxID=1917867 RepID=UPI0038BD61AD